MTEMSRRHFLGAGAAAGASLYVPGWSWAGAQSVAGIGGTTPPWTVWDRPADRVVAAVIERG
jgi:TAT (twin-arginine translocation) pathway signal sequence